MNKVSLVAFKRDEDIGSFQLLQILVQTAKSLVSFIGRSLNQQSKQQWWFRELLNSLYYSILWSNKAVRRLNLNQGYYVCLGGEMDRKAYPKPQGLST